MATIYFCGIKYMDIYVIEETNSREKDIKWHEMCCYLITDVGRGGIFMQHKITVWFIVIWQKSFAVVWVNCFGLELHRLKAGKKLKTTWVEKWTTIMEIFPN